MGMAGSGAEPTRFVVVRVPVDTFLRSQDHQEDLLRELRLIDLADQFGLGEADAAEEILQLVSEIHSRFRDVRGTTRAQALAAREAGADEVDLVVPVYDGMDDALRHWLELLEQADQLCARGEVLTLPADPDVQVLRRRYVRDITDANRDHRAEATRT